MTSPTIDLRNLSEESHAPPEEIIASALALYAALPAPARTAALEALRSPDPAAHTELVREIARAVAAHQLQARRAAIIRAANGGVMPPEAPIDLAEDTAQGDEAVRLVKESRELRAGLRHGR